VLTRCPACDTCFRVTPEQLKARAGRVRCGQCQHAFNALDTLIDEVVAASPSVAKTAEPVGADHVPDSQDLHAWPAPALPVAEPDSLPEPEIAVSPAPTFDEQTSEDLELAVTEPATTPQIEPDAPAEAPDQLEEQTVVAEQYEPTDPLNTDVLVTEPEPISDFLVQDERPPLLWPWVIGSFFALLALGLQALFTFRVELAVLVPETKPALIAFCEIVGCTVELPSKADQLSIEASDLHPDLEQKPRLALTATLKNRAPFAQAFPHLELTLTDSTDKAIARKVLVPMDYLPPKTKLAAGMQANADLAVSISIDPADLPASGYRLYLFYP